MKRILYTFALLCALDFAVFGQGAAPLTVQEADGSPKKAGITKLVVTNGTLTISGTTATIVTGGGGSGSPGGSTTQVQYNDTGAFAGAAGFTFNGTSTVTLGVAGTSVGAIAFKNATSGTVTLQPVTGALGTVTLSLPAATDTLVGLAATQTLTNKTLTAPVIATISNTGTLTLPTSTDTLVGRATTDTLTNKTLTAPVIATIVNTGTLTLPTSTDTVLGRATTDTLTNKTLDVEGTGNLVTIPVKLWFPAAGCNNATASPFWDLPAATPAVAACVTGSNIQKGVLDFADTAGGFSAQTTYLLPGDFTGSIDTDIYWTTTATSGNAKWSVSTACTATNAAETDDPAFNTASTVTTAAPGTANRVQTSSISGVTATGCAANELLHVKIFRDGNDGADTLAATARLVGINITIRRGM